ncbi:helix-turn-helix transcriptional regulator [Piscibacillus halophilus]|uniref:helix-turn-helix transcriptional regulator n=1 Tax=Piscibacillus halophilus TaxID=571933 RepID=UPI0024096B5B|nr:WYL domain-containing protein [Piscibacillus halophilus]
MLYQQDILNLLERNYNIEITRKTLSKRITYLRDGGYIKGERGIYKVNKFSDNELRILIDSILFASYIPAKEAKNIIEKLKSLSPISLKNKIRNIHYVQSFNRTRNDQLYPTLDTIDEAISKRKQIKITVCRFNEHAVLEDIRTELIHPYYIVNSNSRYYVICYADRGDQLESRRIDRISKVEILEEGIRPLRNIIGERQNFDLGQYMNQHIYMFSGKSVPIKIKLKKEHIGIFIDWYGTDYTISERDQDEITISVRANENATYYWALQYGHLVEIVEPVSLREKLQQGLKDILKKYD